MELFAFVRLEDAVVFVVSFKALEIIRLHLDAGTSPCGKSAALTSPREEFSEPGLISIDDRGPDRGHNILQGDRSFTELYLKKMQVFHDLSRKIFLPDSLPEP